MYYIEISDLLFGTIFFTVGLIGVIKSVAVIFWGKRVILPFWGWLFVLYKIKYLKKKFEYDKRIIMYETKYMKPFAIYYLLVMPMMIIYGIVKISKWIALF